MASRHSSPAWLVTLRRGITITILVGIGACATQQVLREVRRGPAEATLRVTVRGVRSTDGDVRLALFGDEDGFPNEVEKAVRTDVQAVQGEVHVIELSELPTGPYAVSLFHDEDADGEMATDFVGRPKEGYGISNDASSTFGPPKYEDARIELAAGETEIQIQMRY